MTDLQLRRRILRHFADAGSAPTEDDLLAWGIGDPADSLRRLREAHAVVLDGAGSIVMAHPFSGVASDWRVRTPEQAWFANCAWDAIAIPIAVGVDASIDAPWLDAPGGVELSVIGGEVVGGPGFVHFEVAARHWWTDIFHT